MKYKILYSVPYEGWNVVDMDNDFESLEEAIKFAKELSLENRNTDNSYKVVSVHSKEISQGKELK